MKKTTMIAVVVAALAFGFAGTTRATDSFVLAGSAPTLALPAVNGRIVGDSMVYSVTSNSTLSVYRPRVRSTMYAAVANASNAVAISTLSSNTVDGYTPTVGTDYLLFRHSGTSGYQLRLISSVSDYQGGSSSSSNVTTYTLASGITVAAGDNVYFCDVPDVVSIPTIAANNGELLLAPFASFPNMPLYFSLPGVAGTTTTISGNYHIEQGTAGQ